VIEIGYGAKVKYLAPRGKGPLVATHSAVLGHKGAKSGDGARRIDRGQHKVHYVVRSENPENHAENCRSTNDKSDEQCVH
jgi:hypothetical protein